MAPQALRAAPSNATGRQPEESASPTPNLSTVAALKDQVWAVKARCILDAKFVKQAQINEDLSSELSGLKENYLALTRTHAALKEGLSLGQAEIKALVARVAMLEGDAVHTKTSIKEAAAGAAVNRGRCLWPMLQVVVLMSLQQTPQSLIMTSMTYLHDPKLRRVSLHHLVLREPQHGKEFVVVSAPLDNDDMNFINRQ